MQDRPHIPVTTGHLPTATIRRHVVIGSEIRECARHGAYTANLEELQPTIPCCKPFWTSCPTCDGEVQAEADLRDQEIRGGMSAKQAALAARIHYAGIPARYLESTLWNWTHGMDQQKRVWSWARDYAASFELALSSGRSGIFLGAPGTGKTHLACGLLRHILEKGGTGSYVTVMSMLGRIKDTYNRAATETEQQAINAFVTCDMLVVDEVGRSLDTNYELAQFFRVMDARYQNLKPTLLVTNMNRAQLATFLGAAVVDRMRENGGAVLVFDWGSQRSAKPKETEDGA